MSTSRLSSLRIHRHGDLSNRRARLRQSRLRCFRGSRSFFLASLLLLLASDIMGGPIPPKVIVDGSALTTTATQPERIEGEWYLPAEPIAQLLQYRLEFDPLSLRVTLLDPIAGRILSYDGITGQVTDNDVAQMFFSPGLVLGNDEQNLRLPLALIAALLDMEAWISPGQEQISLIRKGAGFRMHHESLSSFRMREVHYQGHGRRLGNSDGADLTLRSIADLKGGALRANVSLRGASESSLTFRGASASYWNGSDRRVTIGDLYGSRGLSWQRASGRGISWEQERTGGKQRWVVSAVQLLSGTTGDVARGSPHYDRHAISGSYTLGARAGAPEGASLSLGASWLEGTSPQLEAEGAAEGGPAGGLIAAEGSWNRSGLRLESRTGVFLTSGANGESPSWDILGHWSPWKPLRVQARAYDYQPGFRLPNAGFSGRGRRLYSFGSSLAIGRHLQIQGSQVRQRHLERVGDVDTIGDPDTPEVETRVPGTDEIWTDYSTLGISLQTRRHTLRSLTFTASIPTENAITGRWSLLTATRGNVVGLDWFAHHRQQINTLQATETLTSGVQRNIGSAGRVQVAGNWYEQKHRGGSVLWSPPPIRSGRIHFTLGERWVVARGGTTYRSFGRLRWKFRHNHSMDLSIHETNGEPSIRVAFKGDWSFRKSSNRSSVRLPRSLRHVGELGGQIYLDKNVNGKFDDEDRPLGGITILLDGGKYRAQSLPDGSYDFGEVAVGEHRISVLARSVRADLVLLENRRRKVTTSAFARSSVDFRLGLNCTVTGHAYFDENENGRYDTGDAPARDVRLLINGRQDTMTDSAGSFSLGDIPPGRQTLLVDPSSVPRDFIPPRSLEVLIPSDGDPEVVWIAIRPKPKNVIRKSFSSRANSPSTVH